MGKVTGPQSPFEIEGVKWDYWGSATTAEVQWWCTSVVIDKHHNFAVWYCPQKRGDNFLCVWYRTGESPAGKDECWMGPLEAMALLHEALKGNWYGA